MGYYNPIYSNGRGYLPLRRQKGRRDGLSRVGSAAQKKTRAFVCPAQAARNENLSRLATPDHLDTTSAPRVVQNTCGPLCINVSEFTGITGSAEADAGPMSPRIPYASQKPAAYPVIVGLV